MKKLMIIIMIGWMLISAEKSPACEVTFTPETVEKAVVGETLTVEAILKYEHRKCVIEKDDTNLEMSENVRIVNDTGWEKVKRRLYHNFFDIQVMEEGEAWFRIFRECSKKDISEGILRIQVVQ